jgi:endonuclease-3
MPQPNRAALIAKAHKTLKKHYTPVDYAERPLLEQLIFACCLENATYDAAEQAFQKLSTGFFDWNEVRVSTVEELAEALAMLPEPKTAASRVKRLLYSVFESTYSFDIEPFKKLNLGVAQQKLEKLEGVSPFALAVATQACLGGHAIPLDRGTFSALRILGIATDTDVEKGAVPGMERAIPKSKGVEFGSLLHQLGAEVIANPFSTNLHKLLLEIAPEAKERLPKRQPKAPPKPEAKEPTPVETPKTPARGAKPTGKPEPSMSKAPETKQPVKKADDRAKPAASDKAHDKAAEKAQEKAHDKKPAHTPEKKPAPPKKAEPAAKKPAVSKEAPKKKPAASMPKRKPR